MTTAIVVGAGVFGLSIAREFALRGWSVRVIDERGPGQTGPSAAESRVLRFAHGTDEWYTASALRALDGWRELAAETGREFFVDCGVLLIEPENAAGTWELDSRAVLERLGIPVERLTSREIASRFPAFALNGVGFAVYEPTAGVLRARDAVLALAASAIAAGAELIRGTAVPDRDRVVVDGVPGTADLIVWAPGPRLPALFPGMTSARRVRQDSFYVAAPAAAEPGPAWLDTGRGMYGVPALSSAGTKVVPDVELEPDAPGRGDADVRGYLDARFPGLRDAPVLRREPCFYTAMPDGHFLLGPHPRMTRTWLVGGDCGHGFKHGPAWGHYVCDVVEGRSAPPARFALR
ncbi:FAD-dependent oxidoreductase [Amycolatopsis anabasis]|uniref:FAD-dependent oxidoreductase n=1 Tax=Amycolatopsis anabasis TaxID=1840409 RepID=UPI00131DCBE3|nr:FAD-dependent oxidoreductase [Amycolatopsis anabasis]